MGKPQDINKSNFENNGLIANFMGWGLHVHVGSVHLYIKGGIIKPISELNYDSNWTLLIPVLRQIREVVNVEMSVDDYSNFEGLGQRLNPYEYDIDSIYKGVVEFIKKYNYIEDNR